ncbi:hypothetical protein GH714_029954 [Hevea brasiliensis]|uniref:Ribosome production factor 2 homolog n=1 Tax=Hevea brasiliensis TaxID=3981 RepID=A0A6A6M439_HEVBR|nr:hypothetical protein GH714_029954 [Hevea brasiliensis]
MAVDSAVVQISELKSNHVEGKNPKKGSIKSELEKRDPKLVETGKTTLILQGTNTSSVLNAVLADLSSKEEVGPSMDLVVRCHRLPNESLRKEAMKTAKDWPKKKHKVSADAILGKVGKIYIPDQKIGDMALPNKSKGVKRERCEAKMKNGNDDHTSKKQKED